ncbi:hypothetical protein GF339_03230 [candidate division KSB3 bacterium]|jgi:hypothetical protein|uniref:Uncharacterized protein n=1 Tax=candidate division KSB3 bacterium TaxID=2044937 RepID=A0A9D5JT36_9BACT|nr:hypothetical protein [candidate division KSB3 bacterium]MBD3323569.1 hypothetical protein [candidate division KSB3 bacterium]
MEVIRKRHRKSKEALKQLFIDLLQDNGFASSIEWDGFRFTGKAYGTQIIGEIFDQELHLEVSGIFEKQAVQQIRASWRELVINHLV